MHDTLANNDWHLEQQPSWNAENEVSHALRGLAGSTDESGHAAYSRMLYATGNNHAGTYYPVVLAVIPFLGEILRDRTCTSAARARTLDVLIDLVASFEPEPGFEGVVTAAGARPLKDLLRARIVELVVDVEALRELPDESKLARELLGLLEE